MKTKLSNNQSYLVLDTFLNGSHYFPSLSKARPVRNTYKQDLENFTVIDSKQITTTHIQPNIISPKNQ